MEEKIKEELLKLEDKSYKEFNQKLCPDTKKKMLGIRIPQLRNLAKEIIKNYDCEEYLKNSEDTYFEEILLQGFIIGYSKKEFKEKEDLIKNFIPKMDSWAITDTFVPTLKIKKKDLEIVWQFILPYTKSKKEFEIRFAVIMMLDYYIIDDYVDKVIKILDKINHDGYYVKMGVAWCLAEIGIKYNEKLMNYMSRENSLDKFTYNKTLQKMIESRRITDEQKDILRKMKL